MCGFVYAQNTQPKKPKPKKAPKTNQPIIKDTASIVPDTLPTVIEEAEFDPMDTVTMRESKQSIKSKVTYDARDSMPYDAVNKVFYLYGNAKITQDDLTLTAEFIKADLNTHLVVANGIKDTAGNLKGKPVFKQGATEYKAEVIKYNTQTKRGYLSEFRTKEGEGYIHGQDVGKTEDNQFNIQDAKYTTCNLDSPHFHIAASRIKVIPDKKIVTGPANLQIENIPTPLLLPFGIFSIKKGQASGVIIPTYGNSIDRGYFLRDGGYYFGLGEHLDYRLTGSFYSNTSWALNNALRYANRYRFAGDLMYNYNHNIFYEEFDPNYTRSNDFLFSWNHRSDPKARPNTTFTSSVNIMSVSQDGRTYTENNSYNPTNIVTNQLNSSISFNKGFKNGKYNFSTNANMSQNTATRDVIITFPAATFTVSSFTPFKSKYKSVADKWYENISVGYTANAKNQVTTKDSILFGGGVDNKNLSTFLDTASRYGMIQNVPIRTSFKILKFYTLGADVNLNEYWYGKTIRKDTFNNGTLNRNVNGFERALTYSPSLSLNTRYYGIKNFSKGKIAAIRHVVSPTIGASYAPDFSEDQYGYYRSYTNAQGQQIKYSIFEGGIVGGPSIGRQGNLNFGLDNNIEMKVRRGKDTAQKEEKIQIFERLALNGSYNFLADSLKLSVIRLNAQTKLFKNISVLANASFDPYVNQIITGANGFKNVVRVDQFYYHNQSKLGLFTDGTIGLNATLNPKVFNKKASEKKQFEDELKYINDNINEYYDFNIPWNLTIYYSVGYNRYQNLNDPTQSNYTQTLNFNGDFNLTSNWKIGYNSGYDIKNKQLNPYTSIDIIRQLHCWEFKFNWFPIGPRQSFLFTINVKSSLLQDLKLTRRRDWNDRRI
jgi:hypothetical protein